MSQTIAILIAGGSGHRMGQDIPKQFINVFDKPVIVYTLIFFILLLTLIPPSILPTQLERLQQILSDAIIC